MKVLRWEGERKTKCLIHHGSQVQDMIIGQEGTPLEHKIVTADWYNFCKISNIQTGKRVRRIALGYPCKSLTVDKAQTLIAVGLAAGAGKVLFIDTRSLRIVKEVVLDINASICSLTFNRRNDTLLAVASNGRGGNSEVYSLKFR